MSNIEKLIKGLGCVCEMDERPDTCPCDFYYGNGCAWNIATEVIAILKDPDRIKVTRCKDCKHATMTSDGLVCKYCELVTDDDGCEKRVNYDANWYCGSAERVSE